MGRKSKKKQSGWLPPKGASAYFHPSADDEFKEKHPVGYVFLVILGMVALLLPLVMYGIVLGDGEVTGWFWLGFAGCFVVGIGLFNIVAIIIKQYLGHFVTILSLLIGGAMIAVSLSQQLG